MGNEPIRIIGNRAGQASTTDVVIIHAAKTQFVFSNPLLAIPIPSTGNTVIPVTKLINLKRVLLKVIIQGYVVDTTPTYSSANLDLNTQACNTGSSDGSARAVGFTAATGALVYSGAGCTAITKAIEKKWVLEQFALAGANGGAGLTIQWRNILSPTGTDYMANAFSQHAFISELTVTDDSSYKTYLDGATPPFHYPEMFPVQITLVIGDPTQ